MAPVRLEAILIHYVDGVEFYVLELVVRRLCVYIWGCSRDWLKIAQWLISVSELVHVGTEAGQSSPAPCLLATYDQPLEINTAVPLDKSSQMCSHEYSVILPPCLVFSFFSFWFFEAGIGFPAQEYGTWLTLWHIRPAAEQTHTPHGSGQVDIQRASSHCAMPFTGNPSMTLFDTVTHRSTSDSLTVECVNVCVVSVLTLLAFFFFFCLLPVLVSHLISAYSKNRKRITMNLRELHLHILSLYISQSTALEVILNTLWQLI